MSKSFDKRLLNANAYIMGQGVGLAALESMFNLVQTQSMLSASMLRHHELAAAMSFDTAASAITEILEGDCSCGGRRDAYASAVHVDMPSPSAKGASANNASSFSRGAAPSGVLNDLAEGQGSSFSRGAAPGGVLGALADAPASHDTSTTRESTSVTEVGSDITNERLHELLMAIVHMLEGHLTEMTRNARPNLMVT